MRSHYPAPLAQLIERVINLATRLRTDKNPTPNRSFLRRTPRIRRNHPNRPLDRTNTSSSDAPVIPSPVVEVVPNRDIRRINQSNPGETHYPTISGPSPRSRPLPALPIETIPVHLPLTAGLHCYYPEYSFLAENIPTHNYQELVQFFTHCQSLLTTQPIVYINHPLARLQDITTNPLNFVGFLWRIQVTITLQGITERYSYICRHTRQGHPDKAILENAFDVGFAWTSHHWTVTPVTPR
jgi:hypothetical protein